MAAKARWATAAKKQILQVVKFFGFCSLNYLRLDWPPDFRTDMQTTVLVRLYLFAVGEGRPSRTNRPPRLAQYSPGLQHGKNNSQYVQPSN